MRAFDLLAKAEQDIRRSPRTRAITSRWSLLRWMHLRKLVPLADLLEQIGGAGISGSGAPASKLVAPTSGEARTDKQQSCPDERQGCTDA